MSLTADTRILWLLLMNAGSERHIYRGLCPASIENGSLPVSEDDIRDALSLDPRCPACRHIKALLVEATA